MQINLASIFSSTLKMVYVITGIMKSITNSKHLMHVQYRRKKGDEKKNCKTINDTRQLLGNADRKLENEKYMRQTLNLLKFIKYSGKNKWVINFKLFHIFWCSFKSSYSAFVRFFFFSFFFSACSLSQNAITYGKLPQFRMMQKWKSHLMQRIQANEQNRFA